MPLTTSEIGGNVKAVALALVTIVERRVIYAVTAL